MRVFAFGKGIEVETHILRTGNIEDLPFGEDSEVRKVKGLNVIDPEAGEKWLLCLQSAGKRETA